MYVKCANTPNGNGSWNFHNSPDGAGGDETFKFTSAGTYTVEGYGEDATDAFNLAFRTFSFIIYSGTKVSVSNVSMEVLNDCGVHTWYDQTKDLTQLSTYFDDTLSSSNIGVNAMTEEFGTFLGRDNAVKLTSTGGNTQRFDSIDFGIGAGESVRFTAQIYVPSTNTALDSFAYSERFDVSGFSRKQGVITPTQDQWVDIDFNYVQNDDTIQRLIFWNSASSTPTANNISDGDVIYFRDMVVTRVTKAQQDAVQGTAAYQPKIAENGALLADGIDFDGTDDFLQTSTQVLTGTETGANSMYVVLKQTTGDAGYICGSASTSVGADQIGQSLYGNNNGSYFALSNGNNIDSPERDKITIIQGSTALVSANYSNNNTNTLNKNANNNGYLNGTEAYDFNAGSKFTIGARDGSTATAVLFNGSMKEIIAYNSDQSDNRFKIESNINNYYGLYNDEYEWDDATNTEWQNHVTDGTTTFTANGKDGFTITATGNNISNFKYAITSPSTASDDYYQVSFNVDDPDGLFTNAQLRATATGAGATSQTIDNGFNALSLRTGSSFEYMAINSNGGGSSKTATLSDFKISLIARDGLVETWYDQSGNGNNATQASALKQPHIVEHGGLCKMQSGNAAVKGTRYTSSTIVFLELDNTIAEPTTIFSTYYTNRSFSLLYCGSNVGGAPRVQLNTNGIKPQFSSADDMGTTSVDNTKDSLMTLFSAENGGTAVLRKDGTQIDTLTRTEVESRPLAFLFRHQNNNGRRGVFVDSFIVFNSDKTSDFVEIENELKRANNL